MTDDPWNLPDEDDDPLVQGAVAATYEAYNASMDNAPIHMAFAMSHHPHGARYRELTKGDQDRREGASLALTCIAWADSLIVQSHPTSHILLNLTVHRHRHMVMRGHPEGMAWCRFLLRQIQPEHLDWDACGGMHVPEEVKRIGHVAKKAIDGLETLGPPRPLSVALEQYRHTLRRHGQLL